MKKPIFDFLIRSRLFLKEFTVNSFLVQLVPSVDNSFGKEMYVTVMPISAYMALAFVFGFIQIN